ncbi:MAG TPA: ABC transporter substrate-binding protein [Desulfovibrio sp.]|jgi:ABC-type branched-subunit amino acid transport system substrate-binding protein|uniref:ABC transporter substrate-binding protein n=1 Tax=Desulfovibrio TaxID=872 RepID=UPI002A4C450A|nr:ABC transporter substrate-binding protein [Desulfovibrio sp.]MDY0306639.1 ABC transporter substrate-binding protein [Desulfovibrionaceae bacterium]HMM38397.1 ABC transporter substrate-binding protein [Desulfovibrio sp.]
MAVTARLALCLAVVLLLGACGPAREAAPRQNRTPGVTDTEIVLGSSLALKGHAGFLGTQTLRGALAYLNEVNEQGGVFGRRIRVIAYDDSYDPPRCLANTQKLIIDDDVFALFCYVGTPTTVKIIPLVTEARIPLVGMFTGANALREPFNRYLINVRASYYQETKNAVSHLVKGLGLKRIAVFYQYDAFGFDGLTGTELALKEFGLEPVARGSYVRGSLDVEEGLSRIINSGAEAVVMIGTYEPCAKFIHLAAARGFKAIFYSVSFVGAEELASRLAGLDDEIVIMSQVVPPPEGVAGTRPEDMSEYVRLLRKHFPGDRPNFVGLEGYANARVLVEGLKRAGPRLTREGFLDAVESIRDYSLGPGMSVSFGPGGHQGMERVYFTRLEKGSFVLLHDWSALGKAFQAARSGAAESAP